MLLFSRLLPVLINKQTSQARRRVVAKKSPKNTQNLDSLKKRKGKYIIQTTHCPFLMHETRFFFTATQENTKGSFLF